jgi:hypothetical protein
MNIIMKVDHKCILEYDVFYLINKKMKRSREESEEDERRGEREVYIEDVVELPQEDEAEVPEEDEEGYVDCNPKYKKKGKVQEEEEEEEEKHSNRN